MKRITLNPNRTDYTAIASDETHYYLPYGEVKMEIKAFKKVHDAAGVAEEKNIPLDTPEFKTILTAAGVKKGRQANLIKDYIKGMTDFNAVIK